MSTLLDIVKSDRDALSSLWIEPGFDRVGSSKPELKLAWPLRHFKAQPAGTEMPCTRLVATMVRFLHYHAVYCLATQSPGGEDLKRPPCVGLDLPRCELDAVPSPASEEIFAESFQRACSILGRPVATTESRDSLQPDVIISFFPYADEERANGLSAWASEQLVLKNRERRPKGMVFVLMGDSEVLGVPGSAIEEEERGLDTLRVEMLLKKSLSKSFTSEPPIAVEYERGGADGARAREQNCRLRKQQRAHLVPEDEDLLLLCEKWHIFVARDELSTSEEMSRCFGLGQSNQTAHTPGSFISSSPLPSSISAFEAAASASKGAAFGPDTQVKQLDSSSEKLKPPSDSSIAKFRSRLIHWIRTKMERWDTSQGELKRSLESKHKSREEYQSHLCSLAATRFEKRTGLCDLLFNVEL